MPRPSRALGPSCAIAVWLRAEIRDCEHPRRQVESKEQERKLYDRMVALHKTDLTAESDWAQFGARLLRPPSELPPLAATSASDPTATVLRGSSKEALGASQEEEELEEDATRHAQAQRLVRKQEMLANFATIKKDVEAAEKKRLKAVAHRDFKASLCESRVALAGRIGSDARLDECDSVSDECDSRSDDLRCAVR